MPRLIAHQIRKAKNSREAVDHLRSALIPVSGELAGSFMQELRNAFNGRNPQAGRFVRPAGAQLPFEQRLRNYLRTMGDAEFISFTQAAAGLLRDKMKLESFATGGYVVFAEYDHLEESFLLVALLGTQAHPNFDQDLNLISSETLDFEHLRYAGRVRLRGISENADGVVHFVSRRKDEVSDYFQDFLGCEPITDSTTQGQHLHSALRAFADSHQLQREDREGLMQKTYTYWQECRKTGKPMEMSTLANLLRPEEPKVMLLHLTAESTGLAGEFPVPPAGVMKRFIKFAYSREGLKIEFDKNDWLDKITVKNESVTIRDAPPGLIAQIAEEKNANN